MVFGQTVFVAALFSFSGCLQDIVGTSYWLRVIEHSAIRLFYFLSEFC